jgi:hypothetical protein
MSGGGGGGLNVAGLVKAPLAMAGAAGSLVLAGLQRAGLAAKSAYNKSRTNGHAILGEQVTHHAQNVVQLSTKLKQQGMGEVVDAIRRTGASPAEVFAGMHTGGKYDAIGKRYDRLMKQPEVAQTFADLQMHMSKFDAASKKYAKTGLDLNLDFDTPVKNGADAMLRATEGLPVKDEQGKFKHLQDALHEMTAKIAEMIRALFQRFAPA